jgi:hypothetical protein
MTFVRFAFVDSVEMLVLIDASLQGGAVVHRFEAQV